MRGPRLIRLVFGLGVVAALALAVWRPTAAGQANQRPVMVAALAFSPDGKQFLTAGDDKLARVWDAVGFKQVRAFAGHADPVNAVAFSPDGKRVVTGSGDPLSPDRKRFGRDRDGNWVQYGQWEIGRASCRERVWGAVG